MLNAHLIRQQFPILTTRNSSGRPLIYLDNAATTQKPWQVIEAINHYYTHQNANIHRGIYELADQATKAFESAREQVGRFINAASGQVVFCSGTTEGINMVAHGWGMDQLKKGDEVLVTAMEHHANYVPWQVVCQRTGATFKELEVEADGSLDLSKLDQALTNKTRLLAITHISNTTGVINPIRTIVELAHKNQTLVLVDGAQSVAYNQVDMQELDCDFFAFSGHKLYGPMGIGILYGKSEHLSSMSPYQQGGSMIHQVSAKETTFKPSPQRFEAGTPPVAQAIGLGAALSFIQSIGLENIKAHSDSIRQYACSKLSEMNEIEIIGPKENAGAILSLIMKSVHPHDVATILGESGIAVRAGHHCTQPLMRQFGIAGTVRISFSLYNTFEDVDHLVSALNTVRTIMQ